MQHLDEGTIHAWLDGALDAEEVSRVEEHVASCAQCAAAVAEARGLVAGASRILGALDSVPGNVVPRASGGEARQVSVTSGAPRRGVGGKGTLWRTLRLTPARAAAAAVLIVAGATVLVVREQPKDFASHAVESMVVADSSAADPAVSTAPAPVANAPVTTGTAGTAAQAAPSRAAVRESGVSGGVLPGRSASADGRARKADVAAGAGNFGGGRDQAISSARRPGVVPNEPLRDQAAGRGAASRLAPAPVAPPSAMVTGTVSRDSLLVGQRQRADRPAQQSTDSLRRERRAASMAPTAAPEPPPPQDTRQLESPRVNPSVAGCYAVNSEAPTVLPARISLDTVTALGSASAFAVPPSAARSAETPQTANRVREGALRRVSVLDAAAGATASSVTGSWTVVDASTVRVVLVGRDAQPSVLQLQMENADVLRGVVQGRGIAVTLRRVDCR